ncbi:type III-B CRISPR module RAMP protein Cmr4 [Desulfobacter sp.]|uniref:type III-B CRISPR module RAMP protein Cmr4 n=1 Tax=Desulfobacter sp. TaxID=2294 RepID=UPI00257F813B|nr:type III-B CRISPR module RAMP protein Cmr4 [Desulfobacter sp.]
MKTIASIMTMYAVTPCHAGSGSSTGVVDLPIQRERHTNWPMIQASGIKGAMRAHFDRFKEAIKEKPEKEQFDKLTATIFGTSETGDSGHAGALSVGDARILAYPMRSNIAPFVWITCPAVLNRVNRDLSMAGKELLDLSCLDGVSQEKAIWCSGEFKEGERILLEDMEVTATTPADLNAPFLKDAERLMIVDDQVFDYGVSHCTQIMAQITIDQKTGTTRDGSLRYQEELPSDTLMYSVIFWGDSRDDAQTVKQEIISRYITEEVMPDHLQVGGDETLGRGIFSLNWIA